MKRLAMGLVAALAALICRPPAAVAQNSASDRAYADLARLPAAERDKRIEDGARAEGKLVIIHTMRGNLGVDHLAMFHQRYPFLKIELEGDIGSQDAAERLYTEETAGRHLTDVINVALPDLTVLRNKDMLARFSSPAIETILPPYRGFIDPQARWTPWYWSEHGTPTIRAWSRRTRSRPDGTTSAIRSSRAASPSIRPKTATWRASMRCSARTVPKDCSNASARTTPSFSAAMPSAWS